ncbi:cation-translocating P-type ATPase [Clostridium estertheticum]|uniref:Cd(2+)-exporting ATPase n=1 Tax=Clostridium estertheticum TaxID=238834 RepID=A0A5N7IJ00_9CLOT|nr:cation-translocating P-type ATPase [Clostridium estertheticum]MPQ30276.1 cation-translocating P-type ATPase [Clostridium estertheticum]MPQ60952.1 cation-translocating P-type ATPase [Clostridium estertheticum]
MPRIKELPLMRLNLIHCQPGRIRVRSRAMLYLKDESETLITGLLNMHYINKVEYSYIAGSLLVHFDMETLSTEDVIEIIEGHLGAFSLAAFQRERESKNEVTVNERRLQEESVKDMSRRVGISAFSLAYFAITKGGPKLGIEGWRVNILTMPAIISLMLSSSIFKSGVSSLIKTRRPNADTLTMTAILTALLTGRSMSALVTILLSDIAELMTAYTMERTRKAIGDMLNTGDDEVFVINEDGSLTLKAVKDIIINEVVSIQTGDKLSVDGIVVDGNAYIDQSSITGEFFPVYKGINDVVYAGTIVKSGQIRVKVDKIGDDTTVSRIVSMVEDASSRKAQIQTYADRFSAKIIPLNFLLSGMVYVFTKDINRALSMMIIDYSCGVRLSTATAMSACIHNAARNGVLIKGGNYVESLAEADALVLDKTGTITEGRPKIVTILTVEGVKEQELLELAAATEEDSSHPLAYAILEKTRRSGFVIPNHGLIEVEVGRGVTTTVSERKIFVGNKKYMNENHINFDELSLEINQLEKNGESTIYVADNIKFLGVIGVHDALKENVKRALNRLRLLGFDDVRLLTGDMAFQAEKVAARMNMDDYEAELMPADKARTVLSMQSKGSKVIMIGDGINDAPALAYADVGIAIGNTRTDVAIESSNITITNDDLLMIPSAIQLSRTTMKVIRQNFGLVVGINSVGIVLSAIGWLPVIWGSVLHNSSTIFVVLNSGRLLLKDFERRVS